MNAPEKPFNTAVKTAVLTDHTGTADTYAVMDILARGGSFGPDQETAKMLAAAALRVDAALTYVETDVKNEYNRIFLASFMQAMRMFDAAAKNTSIRRILLPHNGNIFDGPARADLRDMLEKYGIAASMPLPSGVTVIFRDRPYACNLTAYGPIRPDLHLLVRDPLDPQKYLPPVDVTRLFVSGSRALADATDALKHKWDRQRLVSFASEKQLDLPLDGTSQRKTDRHTPDLTYLLRARPA